MKGSTIVKGTLILTIAGLLSRIIGFFYRIFLSHKIGAEGLGIYQMVFPISTICFSLCSAAIQTSISRYVAINNAKANAYGAPYLYTIKKTGYTILKSGLLLSLMISFITSVTLYSQSDFIAIHILKEPRCGSLLKYLALSVPLASIHSCIIGYYLGLKKASIPAWSQLIEQIARVTSIYIIVSVSESKNIPLTPTIAIMGTVIAEAVASLFCTIAILSKYTIDFIDKSKEKVMEIQGQGILFFSKKITKLSTPLVVNKIMLNILQSAEAILIPSYLIIYGHNNSEALSIYGILTGMALPLILFPSAITNSIAVMLLPTVAQAQSAKREGRDQSVSVSHTVNNSIGFSIVLGIYCTGIFIAFGENIGTLLFGNARAGDYISILAWLCPFVYLANTLSGILHGLGKTTTIFIQNTISITIRLLCIILLIPNIGIIGYLWGVLVSQLVIASLHLWSVSREVHVSLDSCSMIIKPILVMLIALGGAMFIYTFCVSHLHLPRLISLGAAVAEATFAYFLLLGKNAFRNFAK